MASKEEELRAVVDRLIKVELSYSWKGGGDIPKDIPNIKEELSAARAAYEQTLDILFAGEHARRTLETSVVQERRRLPYVPRRKSPR